MPALPNGASSAAGIRTHADAIPAGTASDVVAIDAGGPATGSFAADKDFSAASWTYATTSAIDTSGISNAAPQAVYQTEREGSNFNYTIPGLAAGATYTVRLSFAELWFKAAGQRVFNVSINKVAVLNKLDIFAAAGADKAEVQTFTASATSAGTIVINFASVTNNATVAAIEVASGASGGTTPAPTPTPSAEISFVDWPTYGFDTARTGFNPNTDDITPASIAKLHVAWQHSLGGSQSQPIIVTNVAGHQALLIVANYATARAYDALSGALVWQTKLPIQSVQDCGNAGISGTAQYDKALGALFMAAGNGGGAPNHAVLYRLDVGTGKVTGHVDVTPTLLPGEADYAHSGITLANGRIYLGTGSDCEASSIAKYVSWRGRVVSVDPGSMTLLSTFFTTWGQGGNYGGGGVWAWGAVSADPGGNIYAASGNAETDKTTGSQHAAPPFERTTDEQAGYAEHLVKLSGDLSTVEGSNYPGFNFAIGWGDLDYSGTPVLYQPPVTAGCGLLSATQGKGGTLVINNTANLAELHSYALSVPNAGALYIGNPGYSPATGYLYAAISSAGNGSSLLPPGLAAIGGCGSSMAWHAQFGPDSAAYSGENPRSAPTVTAGGVVFIGTPCTSNGSGGCGAPRTANGALWAVDATTGSVLGGGKPVLITGGNIRMAPSADGSWLFLLDDSGNLSALTVDSSVKAVAARIGEHVTPLFSIRGR